MQQEPGHGKQEVWSSPCVKFGAEKPFSGMLNKVYVCMYHMHATVPCGKRFSCSLLCSFCSTIHETAACNLVLEPKKLLGTGMLPL